MLMLTLNNLEHPLWPAARRIYEEAFAPHSRKPEALIRAMLERGLALVHILAERDGGGELSPVAIALAGPSGGGRVLVVDYLAVDSRRRGHGYGTLLLAKLDEWAGRHAAGALALLVEAEAEATADNRRRIRFWEQAGFHATGYVHRYIWVPEPYRALYRPFSSGNSLSRDQEALFLEGDGQQLFRWISDFHRRSYKGFKEED